MSKRRVVITGLGCVTPCGNSPQELWDSLMAGKHGFTLEPWFPEEKPEEPSEAENSEPKPAAPEKEPEQESVSTKTTDNLPFFNSASDAKPQRHNDLKFGKNNGNK